jgi:membrane-bound lytic murein transglycosylase D
METSSDAPYVNFDYKSLNGVGGTLLKPGISDEETSASDVLSLSGKYISAVIAKNLGMDIKDFNRYNPGFDDMLASSGTYDLRLPNDKMDLFVANKYPILNECVQQLLGDVNVNTKTIYKKRVK